MIWHFYAAVYYCCSILLFLFVNFDFFCILFPISKEWQAMREQGPQWKLNKREKHIELKSRIDFASFVPFDFYFFFVCVRSSHWFTLIHSRSQICVYTFAIEWFYTTESQAFNYSFIKSINRTAKQNKISIATDVSVCGPRISFEFCTAFLRHQ